MLLLRICTITLLASVVCAAGVFAVPAIKLAACTINKSGSTVIFRFLNAAADKKKFDSFSIAGHRAAAAFPRFIGKRLTMMLADPSWTKIAVLREPAERFASAFQHKCIRTANKEACPESDDVRMGDVHAVITAMETQAAAKGVDSLDAHFRPYSVSCDLKTSLSSYFVIPYGEFSAGLIAAMNAMQGISEEKRESLVSAVHRLFPLNMSTIKTDKLNRAPPGSSAALAQGWRDAAASLTPHPDADILPRLKKIYAEDFEMYENFMAERSKNTDS